MCGVGGHLPWGSVLSIYHVDLRIKLRLSCLEASALTCWAILPALFVFLSQDLAIFLANFRCAKKFEYGWSRPTFQSHDGGQWAQSSIVYLCLCVCMNVVLRIMIIYQASV